jgi:hypothetical protein
LNNQNELKIIYNVLFSMWVAALWVAVISVLTGCSNYRLLASEEGTIEYRDYAEEVVCPDRSLFTSDFEYNMSLTEAQQKECKLLENKAGLNVSLRRQTKAEKQKSEEEAIGELQQ